MLLQPSEVNRVLDLPSKPMPVWGQPDWAADIDDTFREERARSGVKRGPKPSFGSHTHERTDGETKLYIMQLMGPVSSIFSSSMHERIVIKVGISNDVNRRAEELNWAFPPTCNLRWKIAMAQRFDCGEDAFDAESSLLDYLETKGFRLAGREFAVIPEKELLPLMSKASETSAFMISGASRPSNKS